MLKNKHIIVGVTGGIAAYKIPMLVREFRKAGAGVKVVMSEAAKEFVSPLTLSTLSNNDVIIGTFPGTRSNVLDAKTWHINLGQWGDVMVIAPATANVLAKLAHGYSDDAVSTLALALRCPLLLSPSMDVDMWEHPATQENVTRLREMGCIVLPPEGGELASGLVGAGRLPEIAEILRSVERVLDSARLDLKGRNILVTAGPTYEPIDPVRFIGNRSSGKMGFALANASAQRGASVTLVTGRVHLPTPKHVKRIDVETAEQMYRAVMRQQKKADAIIMSAAVADFTPVTTSVKKIKKFQADGRAMSIELKKTRDVLQELGAKNSRSVLVGFALETDHGVENATRKLKEKKLDLIVLNNPREEGAGFDVDTNVVTIISKNGRVEKLKKMPKYDAAQEILNRVARLMK
ncbi:MAG TPA: bifunctional phosphopantothenoylcysteine decarboxylase/phosphopantothenate--cysteine ligase CoaBC [Bacteroidota bacterium]|jgi:phosphopantothenoylcysteine decarboxylase/phosphopantothenate--cysteine ligase|nr:bifunctional phosphopantothenoylcysteine decarboxylase/phosphopantothenate--cysteine ligase CoaBC [Bacteroidota bacterium]